MVSPQLRQAIEEARLEGRRQHTLGVRMSDVELKRLIKAARAQGIPTATLARVLIKAGLDDIEGRQSGR